MHIGLNIEEKDASQAMGSEIFRIFVDDYIKYSVIPLRIVACTAGGIESTPPQFSKIRVRYFCFHHISCDYGGSTGGVSFDAAEFLDIVF